MTNPPQGSRATKILRSTASAVLIVLACILVPVTVITVWVHDIALDTDRYVKTMKPLATDRDIEDAVRHRLVDAVDVRVNGKQVTADISDWLKSQGLPPRAADAVKALAPQVDEAVNAAADRVAKRFVESDRFEKLWVTANRTAHSAVVHALTGKGRGAIGVEEGTVTLDVGTAVEQVKKDLVNAGIQPASKIPAVEKQVVLFKSDKLDQFQDAAHALDLAGYWMPVITVLLGAVGVLLARRRRRALAKAALGAAFGCLVVAIALVIARHYYLDHLPPTVLSEPAAASVFDTLLRFLKVTLRTVIVLGVVVALGAYFVGPGRLARAVRGWAEQGADTTAGWAGSHGVTTGRVGTWTEAHRKWLTVGVLLLITLVYALWNNPTVLTVVVLVIILLVVLAVIALLAADGRGNARGTPEKQETPG
ncbi:hypothetical protein [Streptomyces chartreusis]